jgi:hypothetical protein
MKIKNIIITFSLTIICFSQLFSQSAVYRKSIPVDELQRDFEVLKAVLTNYHPGLYRYQDSTAIEDHFTLLQNELNRNLSTTDFYLILSRFTAKLKCGHTFCSYYNQNKNIQDSIFNLGDKVPFTFFLFENQMFIDKNLSENNLNEGSQVISINDVPVSLIIESLLPYLKGDGSNDGKRLIDLELSGLGKFEAFDIYFPLLFPPNNSNYEVEIKDIGHNGSQKVNLKCISRAERFALIEQKYGKQPVTYDDLWSFEILNDKTAYIKLGTFVTDKLTIDWKKFLASAFDEIKSKNVPNLIIDIRGNEGGDDEVNLALANHLASKPIAFPEFKQLLTYEKVSDEVRPYLNTWDKGFYDRTGKVIYLNNGFYTWKKDRHSKVISKKKKAYDGDVYLLVNAANSSATFFLATGLQQNKIATIIGTETGGNRKGTNGGNLFFLRLPNSKIEIDIPLIGYYPLVEQPDAGLTPDIIVLPTLTDIKNKKDVVLEKVLELIDKE